MSQPKTRIWILLVPVPSILKFPRLKRDNFPLFETLFWLTFWIFLNQNSFQQQKHDKIFMHCSLCGYKSKCPLAMERHRLSRHVHERRIQSTVSITENHKFNPSLMLPMADLSGLSLNRRNSRQACILGKIRLHRCWWRNVFVTILRYWWRLWAFLSPISFSIC